MMHLPLLFVAATILCSRGYYADTTTTAAATVTTPSVTTMTLTTISPETIVTTDSPLSFPQFHDTKDGRCVCNLSEDYCTATMLKGTVLKTPRQNDTTENTWSEPLLSDNATICGCFLITMYQQNATEEDAASITSMNYVNGFNDTLLFTILSVQPNTTGDIIQLQYSGTKQIVTYDGSNSLLQLVMIYVNSVMAALTS